MRNSFGHNLATPKRNEKCDVRFKSTFKITHANDCYLTYREISKKARYESKKTIHEVNTGDNKYKLTKSIKLNHQTNPFQIQYNIITY